MRQFKQEQKNNLEGKPGEYLSKCQKDDILDQDKLLLKINGALNTLRIMY